ncbi:MAG: cell wall hydrolase [Clostridia bacterium]|nr:cell wall hydrolase [Clostridia bacterium]
MKRLLSALLLCFSLISVFSISVSASSASVPVYIDNQKFTGTVQVTDYTTYVGIRKFATTMDPNAKVTYNYSTRTLTIKTSKLTLTCVDGSNYIVANGRYLYFDKPIYMRSGVMYAPVLLLYKAFDAKIRWSNDIGGFYVTRGSGAIISGDKYYREDEVYWLARIISAESRGEPLRGKIAVGNVILNRVKSSSFPNTIYGVIFDRRYGIQFSPVANGTIYNAPTAESIAAAKICLEGYSISSDILYFVNPRIAPNSWISKNGILVATIGNHTFYTIK